MSIARSNFPLGYEDAFDVGYEDPGTGAGKGPVADWVNDNNKKIVVTYSSINGNGYGGYGEVVMGTKGLWYWNENTRSCFIRARAQLRR